MDTATARMFSTLKLLCLLLLGAACILGQECSEFATCLDCVSHDCNFCFSFSTQPSGCYPANETAVGICDSSGVDQSDMWITPSNLTECFGGCISLETCSECLNFSPHCGWCFETNSCVEPSAVCSNFVNDSCTLPCDLRDSCSSCLDPDSPDGCAWDPALDSCKNGPAEGDEIDDVEECPTIPTTFSDSSESQTNSSEEPTSDNDTSIASSWVSSLGAIFAVAVLLQLDP